jgi:hypothetical protein
MGKRVFGPLLVLAGDVGFAASVAATYKGMRSVMINSGGFCASGGPYQIAAGHQCTASETEYVLFGMLGIFLLGGVALAATGWVGGSVIGTGLAMWGFLFGALGVNFLDLGFSPPKGQSGAAGWIVCGVIFELMALGGLIPVGSMLAGWLRRGGKPEPPATLPGSVPIVRAAIPGRRD